MPRLRLSKPRAIAFCLLTLLVLAIPALAGVGVWTPLGPDGAAVTALAVDPANPNVVYAGTVGSGVFRSADGGMTWTASGLASAFRISGLALDPRRPGTVYALAFAPGLFKSTDGGVSWTRTWTGALLPNGEPVFQNALAVDPRSGVLYAATEAGLYRSADGGTTWKPRGTQLLGPVRTLAIDASGTLYAATASRGLWKSADQGASWKAVNQGLPAGVVAALAVDPERPSNLLAGTAQGIYRSTNGGRSWYPAGGPAQQVASLAFQRGGHAYAGYPTTPSLLRSSDGGASWRSAGSWYGAPVTALATTQDRVLAALPDASRLDHSFGLFRSDDQGARWLPSHRGLHGWAMTAVAVDPEDPRVLYASTSWDLWKSTDGGASWRPLDLGLISPERGIADILIDPERPATIWVSLYGPLLRSDDAGATWRTLPPLPSPSRSGLARDPRSPQALWRTGREGIYHSPDGGLSWTFRSIEPQAFRRYSEFYDVQVDPRNPEVVYAAGVSVEVYSLYSILRPRIYRSTDGGTTWQHLSDVLSFNYGAIEAVALDTVHPDTIYAAGSHAFYRSTDAGLSWEAVTGTPEAEISFSGVAAAPAGPGTPPAVYAARSYPPAVLRSTDGGETWTPMRRGLRDFTPGVLAIDPHDPGHILTGTHDGSLFTYTVPR